MKENRLKHSTLQSYELNDMDEINSLVKKTKCIKVDGEFRKKMFFGIAL